MIAVAEAPLSGRIEELRIDCIVVRDRMRMLSEPAVLELAESLEITGLLNPITVLRHIGSGEPTLVTGAHRLEAARRLGWTTIPCLVARYEDDDRAALAEIDENLIRNSLSPAERAIHINTRKDIYERLSPGTRHGAGGRGGRRDPSFGSFSADTAHKTGRSRSSVAQDATRAKRIPKIAEIVSTSLDKGEELDALAGLPPREQAGLIERAKAGEKVSAKQEQKKIARQQREQALGMATQKAADQLGQKLYGVIYADPPWRFQPYSRETGLDRAADNHYPTMTVENIAQMPVPAGPDCVLFLWATVPMLLDALEVLRAWGFQYRSHCIWEKNRISTGYWFRNKHEILLVGVRGSIPAPAPGDQSTSIVAAEVGCHSEKPACFAQIIEALFPNTPRIELFARAPRPGWDVWGNEVVANQPTEPSPV